ncbi:hypothetical protein ACGFXC_10445 [Streptomyces sp. NPDC048507]|uniref:hypothetical protein n=1 Tax=Streptomyces sp. NPDC048507 TaxID=3365560 RepID=UPI003714B38F
MSTPAPEAPALDPAPAVDPATDPAAETGQQPEPEGGTDWKAQARKWEARAKEHAAAAKQLKALEDAQKTDQQRLADQLKAAQDAAAEAESARIAAEVELLRGKVAASKGLTPQQATFLQGASEDDLKRSADALKEAFGAPSTSAKKPVANLQPGALAPGADQVTDMNAWMRRPRID